MKKKVIPILLIILMLINIMQMNFVYGDVRVSQISANTNTQNTTQTAITINANLSKEDRAFEILSKAKKFSDIPDEDKTLFCDYFDVSQNQMMLLENRGHKLTRSLNINYIMNRFILNVDEVEGLFKTNSDVSKFLSEIMTLDNYIDSEMLENNVKQDIKNNLLLGESPKTIKSNLETQKFNTFKKDKKENETTTTQALSLTNQSSLQTNSQPENPHPIQINKYFNAPYEFRKNNNEHISPNNGQLTFSSEDYRLLGVNGNDLSISTLYDSSLANINDMNVNYSYSPGQPVYADVDYIEVYGQKSGYSETTITVTDPNGTTNGTPTKVDIQPEDEKVGTYIDPNDASNAGIAYINNHPNSDTTNSTNTYTNGTKVTLYAQNFTYKLDIEREPILYTRINTTQTTIGTYFSDLLANPESDYSSIHPHGIENNYPNYILVNDYEFNTKDPFMAIRTTTTTTVRTVINYKWYVVTGSGWLYLYTTPDTWTPYNTIKQQTYLEQRYNMGIGWSFGFTSIENDNGTLTLHLGNGQTYKINITPTVGDSNLDKYTLKDLRLEQDSGTYSNGEKNSAYVLIHQDGKKEYFADDGRLLGIRDRYNNTIKFNYSNDSITGCLLISKITDTLGRVVNITYNDTTTGRDVVITTPDSKTIKYVLEKLQGYTNKFVLKKKFDQLNRPTTFDYSIGSTGFSLIDKSTSAQNYYATLTNISYPTGAISTYTYEKAIGNIGSQGLMEYYRIKTREDMDKGVSYNGEYTGYPSYSNIDTLPDTYTYSTTITDSNSTSTTYTFNNKHLLTNSQIKGKTSNLIRSTGYQYNADKLPTAVVNYFYDPTGAKYRIAQTSSTYDDCGNKLTDTDELNHTITKTYDPIYHILNSEVKQIDENTTSKVEYYINPSTGNIDNMKQTHMDNGVDKSIITNYRYDSYGNLTSENMSIGDGKTREISYEYSSDYKNAYLTKINTKVTDADNVIKYIPESMTYNFLTGNKESYTDGKVHKTSYEYDSLGRLLSTINPDLTCALEQTPS